jgi:Transposase DDE domain
MVVGVSMPDTPENRKEWPYAGGQKPGCGFPRAQPVGLFCLATGRLVRFAFADWKAQEIPLARQLIAWIQPKAIVLADRGLCGWGFMALLQRKQVDVVLRLHQARRTREGRVSWPKPPRNAETWDKALWAELPEHLPLRVVTFRVEVKGFRTKEVTVVTTLLDEKQYPDEAIAALDRQRWAIEFFFREIKTTLGLDVLRCQSPQLIEKEVRMQVIACNLIRALMTEAAKTHRVPVDQLSFRVRWTHCANGLRSSLRASLPLASRVKNSCGSSPRTVCSLDPTGPNPAPASDDPKSISCSSSLVTKWSSPLPEI